MIVMITNNIILITINITIITKIHIVTIIMGLAAKSPKNYTMCHTLYIYIYIYIYIERDAYMYTYIYIYIVCMLYVNTPQLRGGSRREGASLKLGSHVYVCIYVYVYIYIYI